MSGCGCEVTVNDESQKRVLFWLLGINAFMFVIELGVGLIADSTALIADSMDMLADAIVYGIALYAIGKSIIHKANAAKVSGYFQLALGLLILIDIVRRGIYGSEPVSVLIIMMGGLALIANVICLLIIRNHRSDEVHMRASWIFSANDVIANLGVICAGILVMITDTRWPDIAVGSIVACVVLRGARLILTDANNEIREAQAI
ncbi:cation transporter [Alteromonas sp. KUL49]|uniref:cation transporter n=1 Tax=Alteromonas sp. KUL49 TaxID=2480798 RepID=UPI00102F0E01|nr:cation transporter [Alteromonas sp. KUL49]TAP40855.1 cation transporter [Alteromonas sp. KUL49]GEA11034.1 hypothetical protein KUL49_14090 [Alteromonas sp. KUL49]